MAAADLQCAWERTVWRWIRALQTEMPPALLDELLSEILAIRAALVALIGETAYQRWHIETLIRLTGEAGQHHAA